MYRGGRIGYSIYGRDTELTINSKKSSRRSAWLSRSGNARKLDPPAKLELVGVLGRLCGMLRERQVHVLAHDMHAHI